MVAFSAGNYPSEVEFNGPSPSSADAENAWRYSTVINYDICFIVAMRPSDLHQFQAVIHEACPSISTVICPSRPHGNFMYLKFVI
jgi:hypothetical protein